MTFEQANAIVEQLEAQAGEIYKLTGTRAVIEVEMHSMVLLRMVEYLDKPLEDKANCMRCLISPNVRLFANANTSRGYFG